MCECSVWAARMQRPGSLTRHSPSGCRCRPETGQAQPHMRASAQAASPSSLAALQTAHAETAVHPWPRADGGTGGALLSPATAVTHAKEGVSACVHVCMCAWHSTAQYLLVRFVQQQHLAVLVIGNDTSHNIVKVCTMNQQAIAAPHNHATTIGGCLRTVLAHSSGDWRPCKHTVWQYYQGAGVPALQDTGTGAGQQKDSRCSQPNGAPSPTVAVVGYRRHPACQAEPDMVRVWVGVCVANQHQYT